MADAERHVLLDPHRQHVGPLAVGHRLEDGDEDHDDERADHAPVGGGERLGSGAAARHPRRQLPVAVEVGGEPEQHEDRGNPEAVAPTVHLRQQAAQQRSGHRPDVDRGAEDHEAVRAARFISLRIQRTDLRRDIALEKSRADHQQQQRQQERLVEGHGQMPGRHRDRAYDHRVALPDPAIGDHATQKRREVHEARIQPEDLRGQRLVRHGASQPLHPAPEARKPGDMLDMPGQQQLVHHVQHHQRGHAVVRKTLPDLGEGQVIQPFGVAGNPPRAVLPGVCARGTHPGGTLQANAPRCQWRPPAAPDQCHEPAWVRLISRAREAKNEENSQ